MLAVHPGRILKRELASRQLSANKLALALRVPSGRITSILNARRAITPETALRLCDSQRIQPETLEEKSEVTPVEST